MTNESIEGVIAIALRVAAALESNGGEYFVGGSLASSLQREPRATNDIDLVITLPIRKIDAFQETLGSDFEVDTDMLRDALLHARTANAFYLPSVTKIDFFGRAHEPFDESEFSRRQRIQVRDRVLVIESPEDTVLRKLLWYRDGGSVSEKQWRDIQSVLRVSRDKMDFDYLNKWARPLGLVDSLALAYQALQ